MATVAEEDVDYDSDPEEAKRSLAMRRREASDDEEGEGDERDKEADCRVGIHSDNSDGEGGVADYDEEEELDGEEEEEEEEVDEGDGVEEEEVYVERGGEGVNGAEFEGSVAMAKESDGDVRSHLDDCTEVHSGKRGDEEKKENEPFSVPTAGAFYMHDDRFRDSAGGRHRRMHGGRRLWESKDDKKWGHDKFEEITLQERHYKEGRRPSKGNFQGRGRNRGIDRGGYVRGNRKGYDNSDNQSQQVPKGVVRGRGPRRYDPTNKSNGPESQMQNKQSVKHLEKTSHVSSGGRISTPSSYSQSNPVPAKKQVFASNLNYASPPFYPSGSSNKEINHTRKKDVQTGSTSRSFCPDAVDRGFSVQHNNVLLRGKNVVDTIGMDKLQIDESICPSVGKPFNNLQMPSTGSSGADASQSSHPRASARGAAVQSLMNYQPDTSHNQVQKVAPTQHTIQRSFVSGKSSTSLLAPAPSLGHQPGSGSQASSPPKTSVAINSLDSGDMDAVSESGKSKGALVGKGRGGSQVSGRGSVVYGGAIGAAGSVGGGHGDQNFPGTPAFLPVMQFGGQNPGGIGVPAVGMAFPGYVAQPQLGSGKSEMTWLPVLAGAAGALGATYCSPYLTVDGAYHSRQSGQTSATGTSSKENNANNGWKPQQRPELVSDEFGQRQNKPRRYSEMNFGQ